ncbi:glycerol-3-phosphate dehydrogenase [bacterium]|nr:MAG: glycerol-3-phosphate dehydrogenase [bacterium]
MARTDLDLIIIGGGIHGAGVARDAARRGLSVSLFEQNDFGSATSSASSKLVHGGLRYLEQLRLRLVRESLVERSTLTRIAGHLVRPLPFLAPIYDDAPRSKVWMGAGLWLYDLLATGHSLGRHRWLDAEDVLQLEPSLNATGLRGAYLFYDAQMNDARLCLENILSARQHGAQVCNYTRVDELIVEDRRVCGVRLQDGREMRAGVVLNAAGPWASSVASGQALSDPVKPRLSRGSHIITRPLTRGHALLLSSPRDGRVFFVMPYKGRSLIGTTEVDHHDSFDSLQATPGEINYLIEETNLRLGKAELDTADVLFSFAGVRALGPDESSDTGQLSREAVVYDDAPGLISILGGKYTTYRAVAERVTDRVQRELGQRATDCFTATETLPGGESPPLEDYFTMAERILTTRYAGLEVEQLRYLVQTYGSRHQDVLRQVSDDPAALAPIEPGLPFTPVEIRYAVHEEMAQTLEDILRRRCYRRYLGPLTTEAESAWNSEFEAAKSTLPQSA